MAFGCLAAETLVEVPLPKAGEDAVTVLEKARDRVRAMSASDKAKGVVVQLAPGVWNFRRTLAFAAADSGEEEAAIVWRGAPGRRTVLRFPGESPRPMDRVSVVRRPGDFIAFDSTHDVTLYDLALEDGSASGVSAKNVRRLCIENISFSNFFDRAVSIVAGESCIVRRCDIGETGNGAISIDGGDLKTQCRGNNVVEDCLIRRPSCLQSGCTNAIQMSGVGHVVRHNEICDAPHPPDRNGLLTPRNGTPLRRDPSAIWNRESLYRTPKVERWQGPFNGEVTPIWIEGEPYKGRPTRCFAFYGIPKGASKEHKVPGIVLVHGGAGTAYPEWVRLWVRRGYAAIAVDNCGALPVYTRSHGWMANPEGGPRGWGGFAQLNAPLEDQWTYHAVAASMLSHSYLRSLDGVETSSIGVTGISWGGFLTCILAAADDRFAYAVPVYGCAFNHEPGGFESRRLEALRWGALWDPSLFLPFAKCPFLWVDGTNDFAFPLGDVKRSADLVAAPQAFCTRVRMPHGHGPVGEAPAEILDFADHFARGRADIVRFTASGVKDGRFAVSFAPNGRTLVRAELLYTEDGPAVDRKARRWQVKPADAFDAAGSASASISPQTSEAVLNLISAEGLIYSSPYWHR